MTAKKTTAGGTAKRKHRRRQDAESETVGTDGLTDQQRVFVEEYLTCWNASEAVRRAKYRSKPNVQGARLLANASIRAAIENRLAQAAMGANEVLARLTDIASNSLADCLTLKGKAWIVDLPKAQRLGKLHLIKSVKATRYGPEVELYSAADALVQLGKVHHLFTDMRIRTWRDDVIDLLRSGQATPEQVTAELGAELATELIVAAGVRRNEGGETQAADRDSGEPARPGAGR